MKNEPLSIWTVYRHPHDFPNQYVARRWLATATPTATDDVLLADDLDALRAKLPAGLFPMAAHADDDPKIVETWM